MTEYITHMFDNVLTTFGLGIVNLSYVNLLLFDSHAKIFSLCDQTLTIHPPEYQQHHSSNSYDFYC